MKESVHQHVMMDSFLFEMFFFNGEVMCVIGLCGFSCYYLYGFHGQSNTTNHVNISTSCPSDINYTHPSLSSVIAVHCTTAVLVATGSSGFVVVCCVTRSPEIHEWCRGVMNLAAPSDQLPVYIVLMADCAVHSQFGRSKTLL